MRGALALYERERRTFVVWQAEQRWWRESFFVRVALTCGARIGGEKEKGAAAALGVRWWPWDRRVTSERGRHAPPCWLFVPRLCPAEPQLLCGKEMTIQMQPFRCPVRFETQRRGGGLAQAAGRRIEITLCSKQQATRVLRAHTNSRRYAPLLDGAPPLLVEYSSRPQGQRESLLFCTGVYPRVARPAGRAVCMCGGVVSSSTLDSTWMGELLLLRKSNGCAGPAHPPPSPGPPNTVRGGHPHSPESG